MFGSLDQRLEMLWDSTVASSGVELPELHPDEMSKQELRIAFVVARRAYNNAYQMLGDDELAEAVLEVYDELFCRVCKFDNTLYGAVASGKHKPLRGFKLENVQKYRKLAEESRAPR
jgi:hypothetical protein